MDYRIYWHGRGGAGVVSKVYEGCTDKQEAMTQFVADQGAHAAQGFVTVTERD